MQEKSRHYLLPLLLPARQSKPLAEYQLPLAMAQTNVFSWQSFPHFWRRERREREEKNLKCMCGECFPPKSRSCLSASSKNTITKHYPWRQRWAHALQRTAMCTRWASSPAPQSSGNLSLHLASVDIVNDGLPRASVKEGSNTGEQNCWKGILCAHPKLYHLRIKHSLCTQTLEDKLYFLPSDHKTQSIKI